MRRRLDVATRVSLILLIGQALLLPPANLRGAPAPSPVDSMDLTRFGSLDEMSEWLDRLHREAVGAKEAHRFTYALQEKILKKSGESISRILELEKRARLTDPKVAGAYKEAFEKNDEILRFIIRYNDDVIDHLQEDKLDKVEDEQAFLDSQEWQMPHRLISLSRYWMSWSGYYRSFLCGSGGGERRTLLDEAVAGFSLTLLDIADPTILAKSLFGRALCFKEMGNDKKAAEDLQAITQHVRHNDPLYMWSLYEQARIAYGAGDRKAALGHLDKLDGEIEEKTLAEVLGNGPAELRERVVLEPRAKALLEGIDREQDKKGEGARRLCREALGVLKRLSPYDAEYATKLYRLVATYPYFFSGSPDQEVGEIGCLALADDRFKNADYAQAARRYRALWGSSDVYIRNRLDDVYFRTGYADCQTGNWKEALASYERLLTEFPKSNLAGKAVCLEYVAAAGNYKQNPSTSNYEKYVETARSYLQKCPNPGDRNGAHFLLGKDCEKRSRKEEARRQFSAVEAGSPEYWPARYYLLKYDVEELERRKEAGKSGTPDTKRLYRQTASQFEKYRGLPKSRGTEPGLAEIAPHMAILEARMLRTGPQVSCEKAIQVLDGFEKRFPGDPSLWLAAMNLRLQCCRDTGRFDQAASQIRAVLQTYPVDQDLWDFLAEWAGTYDEQTRRCKDAGDTGLGDSWAGLALEVYTGMASIAAKQTPFQQYLDVVRFRIAGLLEAKGDMAGAAQTYREILNRTPDAADALSSLGNIYETQGRWNEALAVWRRYEKGLKQGSDVWLECRYRIAVDHSRMGNGKEACEVITMLRVLHPDAGDEAFRRKIRDLESEVCTSPGQTP